MARIKIEDLPEDQTISQQEMKIILGGSVSNELPHNPTFLYYANQDASQITTNYESVLRIWKDTQYSIINNLK